MRRRPLWLRIATRGFCYLKEMQNKTCKEVGSIRYSSRNEHRIVRSSTKRKYMSQHVKDSYWIGRCPRKGCSTVVRLTVEMTGRPKVHNPHTPREFTTISWAPTLGSFYSTYSEGLHCIHHKRSLHWKPINGRFSEKHTCDARCLNAIGPNCECSCGGKNHGAGYSAERLCETR